MKRRQLSQFYALPLCLRLLQVMALAVEDGVPYWYYNAKA